jgi:hypothetical protein
VSPPLLYVTCGSGFNGSLLDTRGNRIRTYWGDLRVSSLLLPVLVKLPRPLVVLRRRAANTETRRPIMSAAGSSVDVGGDKTPGGIPERKTRSCAECRRRRIRCDGFTVPCSQCVYYQVVDRCFYPQRRSRRAPTTKFVLYLSALPSGEG